MVLAMALEITPPNALACAGFCPLSMNFCAAKEPANAAADCFMCLIPCIIGPV